MKILPMINDVIRITKFIYKKITKINFTIILKNMIEIIKTIGVKLLDLIYIVYNIITYKMIKLYTILKS